MELRDFTISPADHRVILTRLRQAGLVSDFTAAVEFAQMALHADKATGTRYVLPWFCTQLIRIKEGKSGAKKKPTMLDDLQWVYNNMDVKDETFTGEPPSPGALPYLRAAQKDAGEFYRLAVPKLLPTARERVGEKTHDLDGDPAIRNVRAVSGIGGMAVGGDGANRLRRKSAIS